MREDVHRSRKVAANDSGRLVVVMNNNSNWNSEDGNEHGGSSFFSIVAEMNHACGKEVAASGSRQCLMLRRMKAPIEMTTSNKMTMSSGKGGIDGEDDHKEGGGGVGRGEGGSER